MIVGQLQTQLQNHYDLMLPYEVIQFVSHDVELARFLANQDQHASSNGDTTCVIEDGECVFIQQSIDTLEFTLYLDESILASVSNPGNSTSTDSNQSPAPTLDDLCTVMEGVSHAVCLLWHAHHRRQIRPVDLELQAEIDKFILLLKAHDTNCNQKKLHRQLFSDCRYLSEHGSGLHERYRRANDSAASYCNWLVDRFIDDLDEAGLRRELARFYRLSGNAKFDRIKRLN